MKDNCFPVFIKPNGRRVVIIGGGAIATRRTGTLLKFDFDITVVSESISEKMNEYVLNNDIKHIADNYDEKYLDEAYMVLACTDKREVNRQIGEDSRKRNLLVSVCDSGDECSFFFPAVAVNDEVTAGLAGSGRTHGITKRAAAEVRKIIERKAY